MDEYSEHSLNVFDSNGVLSAHILAYEYYYINVVYINALEHKIFVDMVVIGPVKASVERIGVGELWFVAGRELIEVCMIAVGDSHLTTANHQNEVVEDLIEVRWLLR